MNGKKDKDVFGFPAPGVPVADHELMLAAGKMVGEQLGGMMAAFTEVHVVANMASRLVAPLWAVMGPGGVNAAMLTEAARCAWGLLQAVKDAQPGPQG